METLLYSDTEGEYFLLDYSPSHSEMIIRKIKGREYNIDLFFKAVYNINLNTKLKGINIFKVDRNESLTTSNFADRKYILKIIDSDGFICFIDAGLFVVFHK